MEIIMTLNKSPLPWYNDPQRKLINYHSNGKETTNGISYR